MQPNTPGDRGVEYAASAARGLAITQLVLGVLCLIAGIAAVAIYPYLVVRATAAMEIWMPISFIIAGIVGIVAASQKTSGIIVAHMVMSIIASLLAFALFVDGCIYGWMLGTHIAIAIFSFAELVIAIISAAFCCRAVCCGNPSSRGTVLSTQQHVVVTTTQPNVYQQHYVAQPGMQYPLQGQYVIQPGVQQQMPSQQYMFPQYPGQLPGQTQAQYPGQTQAQYPGQPPAQYPQATGQATIETKPPPYAEQPTQPEP